MSSPSVSDKAVTPDPKKTDKNPEAVPDAPERAAPKEESDAKKPADSEKKGSQPLADTPNAEPSGQVEKADAEVGSTPTVSTAPRKRKWPFWAHALVVVLCLPVVLLALIYLRLMIGPVSLQLVRPNVEQAIRATLPSGSSIALGDLSLSLSSHFSPVLHFAPVTLTEDGSGATVGIDALEIGFSPFQALIGHPGAVVSLIDPHLQILQDLLGPRLASFTLTEDAESGEMIARVRQGSDIYPDVRIGRKGLTVSGPSPTGDGIGLRSDNDWLIYNMEGMEQAVSLLQAQAGQGQFSRLEVHGGSMELLDPVYGITRRFDDLAARITPGTDDRKAMGSLSATLAGRRLNGTFSRETRDDGTSRLAFSVKNLDFSAIMPMLDDPDAMMALKGGGTLDGALSFDAQSGKVLDGQFDIDVGNTELRLRHDYFPVTAGKFRIDWDPVAGRYTVDETRLGIGRSSAKVAGEFVLGLDDVYGTTIAAALNLTDLVVTPYDMDAPATPFTSFEVKAWSAPLYGAVGLDRVVARKPGVELRAKGRMDMVRRGIGFDIEVGGEGASADDIKRLWPYFLATGARDWFVSHVTAGAVKTGSMRFKLPIGALDPDGKNQPLPDNSGWIDVVGTDVTMIPTDGWTPVALGGDVSLTLRDNKTSVTLGTTQLVSDRGKFTVSDAAVQIDGGDPPESVVEFSGDVKGDIPALVGFIESQSPGTVDGFGLPFNARAVDGTVDGSAVVTMTFDGDNPTPVGIDYAVNGTTEDFISKVKIADRTISNGQLSFQATSDTYHVGGTADLDGVPAELELDGGGDAAVEIKVASTIDVDEFKKFGLDLSNLVKGKIRFVAKPLEDGTLQLAADLREARLSLKDIGLAKALGVPGEASAEIRQDGLVTRVDKIDLSFAHVHVRGALEFDATKGLVFAEFSDFALSEGDSARLSVKPGEQGGFVVSIVGDQFDLKPMLKRYFALDKTSTGAPQATSVPQELEITARLKRAPGFYGVTAYNMDLALDLLGEEVLDASLQTQFTEGNTVSLTSNPTTGGRLMTVAFNDIGTVLRYLNVYPRLLGGSGSLTLRTDTREHVDYGEIRLRDFALVDEAKVVEILGNHRDSRKLIANENRLNFQNGRVTYIRRSDRIEVTDAVLDGGSIGGTIKGFIYTKSRQYDLAGTYIPLFGINNLFQRLPLIGELLGGRSGEGLVGVTFAIRGDLDNPEFVVNPVSILAPGLFRSLFEFRATEAPREEQILPDQSMREDTPATQ